MRSRFKTALLMALIGGISAILTVVAYELYATVKYREWRESFDRDKLSMGVRFLAVRSPNKRLIWEYRPDTKRDLIETNRFGFRERDLPERKPDGERRFAFIGDSVVLGMGVEEQHGFVRQFENLARTNDPAVTALNFGIDGYNAVQIGELLRARVARFSPDVVVYAMHLNDFDFVDASHGKIHYFRKPRSFLLARLRQTLRRFSDADYYEYHYRRTREQVFDEIEQMQDWCARRGIDYRVVIIPIFPPDSATFSDYPQAARHEEITARLDAAGIEVIDLLRSFRGQSAAPSTLAVDLWHPNRNGHAMIAEALVEWLRPTP